MGRARGVWLNMGSGEVGVGCRRSVCVGLWRCELVWDGGRLREAV